MRVSAERATDSEHPVCQRDEINGFPNNSRKDEKS
jgi:hypothetical protein